jgi:hypothetical protein
LGSSNPAVQRYFSAESMAFVLTEPTGPAVEAEEVARLAA